MFVALVLIFNAFIHLVECEAVCGTVTLTYFQTESSTAAKLQFLPNTQLSSFRWVHFYSNKTPNFDFLERVGHDESKYEMKNSTLIIKNLQKSDEGIYNTECYLVNGRQLFSKNKVIIEKPYTIVTTLTPSKVTVHSTSAGPLDVFSESVTTEAIATIFITDDDFKRSTQSISSTVYLTSTNSNATSQQPDEMYDSTSVPDNVAKDTNITIVAVICGSVGFIIAIPIIVVVVWKKTRSRSETHIENSQNQQDNPSYMKAVGEKTEDNAYYSVINETERESPRTELQTFSPLKPSTHKTYENETYPNGAANENEYSEVRELDVEDRRSNGREIITERIEHENEYVSEERLGESFNFDAPGSIMTTHDSYTNVAPEYGNSADFNEGKNVSEKGACYESVEDSANAEATSSEYVNWRL